MLERFGFVVASLALAFTAVSMFKKGYPAAFAVGAVACGVSYFGPQVFGSAWFHEGFWGGFVFGSIVEYALSRGET
jgi:hypothetical protein